MPHVEDSAKRFGFAHAHALADAPLPQEQEEDDDAVFNSYAYWKHPEPEFDLDKLLLPAGRSRGHGATGAGAAVPANPIDALSDDLLCVVFSHVSDLDPRAMALVVPYVCKHWRAVCKEQFQPAFDFRLMERGAPIGARGGKDGPFKHDVWKMSEDKFFRTFVHPFKGLRKVFLSAGPPVKPVSYLGRQMFEVMHKGSPSQINDAWLERLAETCPNLAAFHLHDQFNGQYLDGTHLVTCEGVGKVVRGCRRLTSLTLKHVQHGHKYCAMLTGHCKALTSLHLSFADRGLGTRGAEDAMADADVELLLRCCARLKHLDLSDNYIILDSNTATAHFTGKGVRGCTQLETLNLHKCEGITDEGLASIATHCPLIRELALSNCRHVSDDGLLACVAKLKHLRILRLDDWRDCTDVTEGGINVIRCEFPDLAFDTAPGSDEPYVL